MMFKQILDWKFGLPWRPVSEEELHLQIDKMLAVQFGFQGRSGATKLGNRLWYAREIARQAHKEEIAPQDKIRRACAYMLRIAAIIDSVQSNQKASAGQPNATGPGQ